MPDQYETVADAKIGILMGSASDWPTMQAAAKTLRDLEIPYEANDSSIIGTRWPLVTFFY